MHTLSEPTERSILIVEDSPFEQRMLVDLLSDYPYRLAVASDGLQGYQQALARQPDLILLDVRMPSMDGYAACRLLKANPVTAAIPVIFLSGAAGDAERIMGLSIGGVDYVAKPFSPGELAARIQIHLDLVQRYSAAAAAAPASAPADPDAVLVHAAQRLITDNLAALPSLAEIARSVGTYREKLSQLFRAHTGLTVFAFIREERIRRGEQLLRETDIDVQDIALLIGFNNAGNFATAFRERMGITPSAFRSSMQIRRAPAADPASAARR
ncbi:MAG: response regulator [Sphingomonadaceae bacterium]